MDIFGKQWIVSANNLTDQDSWAHGVVDDIDTVGGIYLNTLRIWFERFPATNKQKKPLKQRLESFSNEDHLGGVNELSCWEFMRSNNLNAEPVPTTTKPRPDFKVLTPTEFFIEVSTLNVSETEKKKLEEEGVISLDHAQTLRRILLKAANDKKNQISYAASERRPCGLVLFDYTTWSAYGTQFFRYLADFLLGQECGFGQLPIELSALVYLERKVKDGRIGISRNRSGVYYNPNAKYPLNGGAFATLKHYWYQMIEVEPKFSDHWIWL